MPQSRIDEAVRRILRVKFELGLFDKPRTGCCFEVKDWTTRLATGQSAGGP